MRDKVYSYLGTTGSLLPEPRPQSAGAKGSLERGRQATRYSRGARPQQAAHRRPLRPPSSPLTKSENRNGFPSLFEEKRHLGQTRSRVWTPFLDGGCSADPSAPLLLLFSLEPRMGIRARQMCKSPIQMLPNCRRSKLSVLPGEVIPRSYGSLGDPSCNLGRWHGAASAFVSAETQACSRDATTLRHWSGAGPIQITGMGVKAHLLWAASLWHGL